MASQDPEDIRAIIEAAREHQDRDDWKEAKKVLQALFKGATKLKASKEELAEASLLMANILSLLTEFKPALDYTKEALKMANELGDQKGKAEATRMLGFIKWRISDYSGALQDMMEALELARALKDTRLEGIQHIEIAMVHSTKGDLGKAEQELREAILTLESTAERKQLARAYNNLGDTLMNQGKYEKATEFFEKSKKVGKRSGAFDMAAFAGFNKAECLFELGRYEEALKELDDSLPVLEEIGDIYGEAGANQVYGLVYAKLGEWQRAEEYLFKARRLAKKSSMPVSEAMIIRDIGRLYMWRGDKDKALLYFKEAKGVFEKHDAGTDLKKVQKDIDDLMSG